MKRVNLFLIIMILTITIFPSYRYNGSGSKSISVNPDWSVTENTINDRYGYSVSTAGDINGDGLDDILVGAYNKNAILCYYGSKNGLDTMYSWIGEVDYPSYLGWSVSYAGDVNNDGFSDIIASAPKYGESGSNGCVVAYYGSSSGLNTDYDWIALNYDTSDDFGSSVSNAGDVNGDGYDDILIGYEEYSNNEIYEGAVYLYYGSENGLKANYDWYYESNDASGRLGRDLSSAGDLNNDGYDDIIVGARDKAYIFYGSSIGLGNANIIYTSVYGEYISVSNANDINGDGYSDIIIGSYLYTNNQNQEGAIFIYYGSSTGIDTLYGVKIESNNEYYAFGQSVSYAGDINGDGYSDVIVGSPGYSDVTENEGAAYIFYGSDSGIDTIYGWMGSESNSSNTRYGFSVSTAGDVDGDNLDEVIIGTPYYRNSSGEQCGAAFLYLGGAGGPGNFSLISPVSDTVSNNTPEYCWQASTTDILDRYEIYINDSLITTTTDTTYIDSNILEDGDYIWQVVAIDTCRDYTYSEQEMFTIDATPPTVPVLIPADYGYTSTNTIYFRSTDNIAGVQDYDIELSEDSTLVSPISFNTSDTSLAVPLDETKYYWKVRATDNLNNVGDWTSIHEFIYDPTLPASFNLIGPDGINNSDNTPTYTWNESYDLRFKDYDLYINGSLKISSTDTFYTEPSPLSDGEYIWYVVSEDSAGNTRQSNQIDTMILDVTKPSKVVLISPSSSSVITSTFNFVWYRAYDNYSGIKHYELQYDTDSLFGSPTIETTTDTVLTIPLFLYQS